MGLSPYPLGRLWPLRPGEGANRGSPAPEIGGRLIPNSPAAYQADFGKDRPAR